MADDKVDFLESSLDRLLGWIAAANERVNTLLTIGTAMLGVIAALCPKTANDWTAAKAVPSALAAVPILAALIAAGFAAFPRTTGKKGSIIFFGGIVSHELEQYRKKVAALDTPDYVEELVVQTHRNAEIANAKYAALCWSMKALFASIVPWLWAIFALHQS